MKDGQIDLTNCDEEPIHLIGAIQPHGALIAVSEDSHVIDYASTNTGAVIGWPYDRLLGSSISDVIGADNTRDLLDMPLDPPAPNLLRPWIIAFDTASGQRKRFECLPHRYGGQIILEFQDAEPSVASVWEEELLRQRILTELVSPGAQQDLADATAKMIREVIGFDRVMVYKFHPDKHGEVIAESTNRPDSFIGHHYPASDIPDPARRHFILNVIRNIPDINCEDVPIVTKGGQALDESSAAPLDLSFSNLRSVAKVHVQYLNNMGVGASMSISLVTNNELWGLITCHNYGPRLISSSRLRFAELLGGATSALLQNIENTQQLKKSTNAEKIAFRMEQDARSGLALSDILLQHADEMMELTGAYGLWIRRMGQTVTVGEAPADAIDMSVMLDRLTDGVATTSSLSDLQIVDAPSGPAVAGAAYLDLSEDKKDYLVFFRTEYVETIKWAGKPEKVELEENGVKRLSPRGSFAVWSQERRGHSKPFEDHDRDALRILRRAIFALNSLEREQQAREAQTKAEAQELKMRHALLDVSRASSMGELASAIAHELNQPLSAIVNYVNACRQELTLSGVTLPGRVEDHIEKAVSESVRAGELVQRIRNFISHGDLNLDLVDVNPALLQGMELALITDDDPDLSVSVELDDTIPQVLADPVQISQVVLNLVRNATTAMAGRADRAILLRSARDGDKVLVVIRDTGPGISHEVRNTLFEPLYTSTTDGMGIGLSLCRTILEAHGGRIWLEPSDRGATFAFHLPIPDRSDD